MNKNLSEIKMNVKVETNEVEEKIAKITEIAKEANDNLEKLTSGKFEIVVDVVHAEEEHRDPHQIVTDRLLEYVKEFDFNKPSYEGLDTLIRVSELILKFNERNHYE